MHLHRALLTRVADLGARLQAPAHDALTLALRLLFGWQFFLAGRGKLQNLDRTGEFFASLGIPAPAAHALGIGLLECVGGLLLLAGAGTRAVSALLAGTMAVALATAHRSEIVADGLDGLFAAAPFPYLLATLALLVFGPGRLAVDHGLRPRLARACQRDASVP